jgi:hypothetical protein
MTDTTVTKVSSAHSPTGDQGEVYLASGKRVSMRLWRDEPPTQDKPSRKHGYEVVGYVISGRAELEIEGRPCGWSRGARGWCPLGPSIPIAFWRRSPQSRQSLLLLRHMAERRLSITTPTATVSCT